MSGNKSIHGRELAEGIQKADFRKLARAITWLENGDPGIGEVMALLPSASGHCRIIGITGPPGAGKSTLSDALVRLLRKNGQRTGLILVDPASPLTGGAILGDRIRLPDHAGDPGVFIRSMSNRGHLGGLAPTTAGVVSLMEAAGFDWVIIETVGTGQAETDIAGLADTVVLVLVPGLGDEVQLMKAGIMEIADLYVVNKGDRDGAERLAAEIRAGLAPRDGWLPEVVCTVATSGQGVEQLRENIENHSRFLGISGQRSAIRAKRREKQYQGALTHLFRQACSRVPQELKKKAADCVQNGIQDPFHAAQEIWECLIRNEAGLQKGQIGQEGKGDA